jgi:6-pyruvoyltetrahydropterin/6-carboxytetrahydropterin synthase
MMQIFIDDSFDSAHYLPHVKDTHKCRRDHGHTYRIRIYFSCPMDEHMGWLVDYNVVKPFWLMIHNRLDHHKLNEVKGLENPTCERITKYIADELQGLLTRLGPKPTVTVAKIELKETEKCGVVWEKGA